MGLRLTEKQAAGWRLLTDRTATRVLFDGAARSGKTMPIIEYLVMRALRFPGCRQLIARKYRVHAYASIWRDSLDRYLREHVPAGLFRKHEEPMLGIRWNNGSEIIIDGLDNDERVDKLLGNEYVTVFVNEARQVSWGVVQRMLTRLAQRVCDEAGRECVPKLILDTNPAGPRHWLHRVGVEHLDPDTMQPLLDAANWARLNWVASDNAANLPEQFLRSLDALPAVERARMRDGIWCQNEGLVYPDIASCIVEPPAKLPEGDLFGGIDWGFSAPFAAVVGVLDGDDVLWIVRCRYKRRTPLSVHAARLPRDVVWFADPAGADQIAELRRADHTVRRAPNSIMAGIAAVSARIRDGRLRILNLTEMQPLLEEAYGYAYPEEHGDSEQPVGVDDHAMDALRYLVAGVDRGRTALLAESDDAVDQTPGTAEPQKRYAPVEDPPPRPREERVPAGEEREGQEWLDPENPAIWSEMR